jgi:3-O-methylgallate 3,4-dioxygenase
MADIVLGLGASHGPPVTMPSELWGMLMEKDQKDKRMDYNALCQTAPANIHDEITPEKMKARYDASQRALGTLQQKLEETRPDVLVVIGDDQKEQFQDENMPAFSVYRGGPMQFFKRKGPQTGMFAGLAYHEHSNATAPDAPRPCEAAPELADSLIRYLTNEDFDISTCSEFREDIGMGHAFHFVYRTIMPECDIPMLPIMVNTMYGPNIPTAKRCYALGEALRKGIEAWDSSKRVAVMASGGLSHVIIDAELDHMVIDALIEKDADRLKGLPFERLNRAAGTSEIRNWIVAAGALDSLDMTVASYESAYRSPAATGVGMGFAYWE